MNRYFPKLMIIIALALFFGVVWYSFREVDQWAILANLKPVSILLNICLGLAWHVSFGVLLKLGFQTHYKLSIESVEILNLPLMMQVFHYLLPANGGLVFQVFYTKNKYQLDLSKGLSFGFQILYISILITVVLGLILLYMLDMASGALLYLLLAMAIGVVTFPLLVFLVPTRQQNTQGLFSRLFGFMSAVKLQITNQLTHAKFMSQLVIITTLMVLIQALWYQQTASMLGLETSFLPMLLMALILRILLQLPMLPGNLGVQEMMIGIVFTTAGFSIDQGLQVALVIRLVSLLLAATIGMAGLYSNLKTMNVQSVRSLIKNVSNTS